MKNVNTNLLLLCFMVGAMVSCGRGDGEMNGYVKTVQSGIKTLPWPKQMEQLYGDGDHFITEYGFSSGPRDWNTVVYFYGKYTLSMHVEVEINTWGHTVGKPVSGPKFYLHEVKSVEPAIGRTSFSDQWVLDEAQWNKLVQAKGDWAVLGIPVKTNEPVEGFSTYVKWTREPRVRIPH